MKYDFTNYYKCDKCNIEWEDEWDSMCNDKCPYCEKEYTPYRSEKNEEDLDLKYNKYSNIKGE